MAETIAKSKIEVNAKSTPIYVIRSGKHRLTITCADSKHGFKVGTSPEQLEKFSERFAFCARLRWPAFSGIDGADRWR